KINLNYGSANETSADWLHINSIDYYGYYDLSGQILLSIPTFDEVWVMWHDFPAEDDVLWRWGNPAAYNRGDSTDQKLFFQHDAHWGESDMALSPGQPEFTQICVFNNRVPTDSVETHSEVATISVIFDEYEGGYELDPSTGTFQPDDFNWVYTEDALNSTGLSSFQWLGDGSYLICNGRTGQLFENSGEGSRIWEYRTPLIGGAPVEQGTALEANQNMTFRAYRYPSDYSAFEGHDVSSGTPLEINPVPLEVCEVSSVHELASKLSWNLYPNPSEDMIELSWNEPFLIDHNLQIFHADGRLVLTAAIRAGTTHWSHDLSGLPGGLYLLQSSTDRSLNLRFIKIN
ncbi:MAG: arylsulfotransferase family protein, partial [Flavobacteriales bacterium]|nr:arylsulfotransferase family protein [Flavobacteriales bacterium]